MECCYGIIIVIVISRILYVWLTGQYPIPVEEDDGPELWFLGDEDHPFY